MEETYFKLDAKELDFEVAKQIKQDMLNLLNQFEQEDAKKLNSKSKKLTKKTKKNIIPS